MAWDSCFATDELTVLLGLIAASTFLLRNLYKPQPLVHPVLLGRQSDASHVRQAGESATYRNYGTGMLGRLPLRPAKDVMVIGDFVKPDADTPRTLWSTKITNPQITARVMALGSGLIRTAGLSQESNVLLLLNDSLEFLLTDLALAANGIPSFTLSSLSLLSEVLESHPPSAIITQGSFMPQLLELIYDSAAHEHHTVIVLGDAKSASHSENVNILSWEDVERQGANLPALNSSRPDVHSTFSVSFFKTPGGRLEAAHLTHENLTAGVAATRILLPLSSAISPLDTILSCHSLSTAYGRAIAYTALFEGCSFATTGSSKLIRGFSSSSTPDSLDDLTSSFTAYPIPSPTILFVTPSHFTQLWTRIATSARSSLLSSLAYRHKLSALSEGFLSKDGLWDRMVFDSARASVIGEGAGSVRALIVTGKDLKADGLPEARVTMSVPIVHTFSHPAVAAPLFATHPLDLQAFPASANASADSFDVMAHVGPPTVNIEAKLYGIHDAAVEGGMDPEGLLSVRGPAVAKVEVIGDHHDDETNKEGWLETGEKAKIMSNGCFKFST